MKPTITGITSDRGAVTPDVQPQTLFIAGINFLNGMILVFEHPDPKDRTKVTGQIVRQPSIQGINEAGCIATVNVAIDSNGPWQAIAIVNGEASDWFSFSVN